MSFIENDNPVGDEGLENEVEQEPQLSGYAQRFIESQPEDQREIAKNWVTEWDKGAQRKFNEYEQQLGRYRQLGDDQTLQAGVQLYNVLVTNPERVLQYLTEDPNGPQLTVKQAQKAMDNAQQQMEGQQPDPYEAKFKTLEEQQQRLLQTFQQRQQQEEMERAKTQFQQDLEAASRTMGPFDRDLVIDLCASGRFTTLAQAVEAAKQLEQRILQSKSRGTAPNLLGSTNAPPVGGKKPSWGDASKDDVTKYLESILTNGQ